MGTQGDGGGGSQRSGPHHVVSDVHGHRAELVEALAAAGLVDAHGSWTGGDAVLSFLGDFFDRGPDGVGVVDLAMSLQREAADHGGRVQALLGNHEILALGMHRFGDAVADPDLGPLGTFARSWRLNGGRRHDQERLTAEHVAWLSGLPALIQAGPYLLMHSDTTEYLHWGESVEAVNAAAAAALGSGEIERHWDWWVRLTSRYDFAAGIGDDDGAAVTADLLERLGGQMVVHGHSIISTLTGQASWEVTGPLLYAGGRALDIDGGLYDGGPCLVVCLDDYQPGSD